MMCTEERFLRDIASHDITFIRDEGRYRHIRFSKPNSIDQRFDLITWPGSLCYTGDMGTFVFSRLEDMFKFFRTDRIHQTNRTGLRINPCYWSEKITAADRGGVKEYSPDRFRAKVLDWVSNLDLSQESLQDLEDQVLSFADEGESEARRAAAEFYLTNDDGKDEEVFADFWEVNLCEYTFRYTWCCFALAWGIQKYDEACEWRATFDV